MFDATSHRQELSRRIDAIRRILAVSHPTPSPAPNMDIGREARGLCIVLLFAAYEHLLTSLCRGLLEAASRLRVGNRRLKPGIRLFAVHGDFQAIQASSTGKLWNEYGPRLFQRLEQPRPCSINVDLFPADGSFMKRSQVSLFCRLFDLGDPGAVLKEAWGNLDSIVSQRNAIAHGGQTPEEVGRNYSISDINGLVDSWELRWREFLDHVELSAASRDFFRNRR